MLEGRAGAVITGEWLAGLSAWAACSPEAAAQVAWPIILTPERVDHELTLPGDAVLLFTEASWREPLTVRRPLTLAGRIRWVSVARGTSEVATETAAWVDGRPVAQALRVARTRTTMGEQGERCLPPPPAGLPGAEGLSLTIDGPWAARFLELIGASSAIHDDTAFAQGLGHETTLVPGLLLVAAALAGGTGRARGGRVQAWFRRPVPVGTCLTVKEVTGAGGDWVRTFAAGPDDAALVSWTSRTRRES